MRRILEVSCLTRPARIRSRPILLRQAYLGAHYRFYAQPARKVEEDDAEWEAVPTFGPRRLEVNDHQVARKMAKDRKVKGIKSEAADGSTLPSLFDRKSFAALPASAMASDDQLDRHAGPSSERTLPVQKSRKGKEKAVDAPATPVRIQSEVNAPTPSAATESPSAKSTKLRRNPVGVQLLSPSLHPQLFPGDPLPKPPDTLLRISRRHLESHGLSPEGAAVLPEINFQMPDLQGGNIREHFRALGQEIAEPYMTMAQEFAASELPAMPPSWEIALPGWTRYGVDGSKEAVSDLGGETVVSFDVETLYKLSPYPVVATAASSTHWYSWLSPTLFEEPPTPTGEKAKPPAWDRRIAPEHPRDLIPLFPKDDARPRIAIGHNVGYDRARIAEEYQLEGTSTKWLDTLSLHVATRGITSVQRPAWMKHKRNKAEEVVRNAEALAVLQEEAELEGDSTMLQSLQEWGSSPDTDLEALQKRWEDVTSVNSLAEVAALHCGKVVDKSIRDRFGNESITHASQLRPELETLIRYCANDVKTTHEVYQKVLPLFMDSCPHPATFAGVLAMGSSFLPVNESWARYLQDSEEKYRELEEGVKKALKILAEKLRKEGLGSGDVWAEQLDWTPKAARWLDDPSGETFDTAADSSHSTDLPAVEQITDISPAWYASIKTDPASLFSASSQRRVLPLLLRLKYKTHPVAFSTQNYWCFAVPHEQMGEYVQDHGEPVHLDNGDEHLETLAEDHAFFRLAKTGESRKTKLTGANVKSMVKKGELTSAHSGLLEQLCGTSQQMEEVLPEVMKCVEEAMSIGKEGIWGLQLDWSTASPGSSVIGGPRGKDNKASRKKTDYGTWPKWYWDLTASATNSNSKVPFGEIDLTTKKTVAPLLLRLQWQGYPLFHSREHKWLYRVPKSAKDSGTRGKPVTFEGKGDDDKMAADSRHHYYRLPHKDGEGNNVGNPLSKPFVKSIESGELASAAAEEGDNVAREAATAATNMNVLCSYWMSSRERIMQQMVVHQDEERTQGMILPQVITMGTVTRRAVEATWLTASNAKKNRVGSELKAMVRAPPGYAIVGADVDSEELWISSVMGDSQFACHGATAIGWMTLEGTKSAGTDLHSKTANILGISRDAAKVFNYSRIYGAGQKHAVQLLMQGDGTLTKETATERAKELYKATKGAKSVRDPKIAPAERPSLWHGGSESYLFNTLEAIALSDRPTTPALGCGVTRALRKSYLEESSSYLPSRINWVVQSSGVDYLHLLITSMGYLLKKYNISARYLISVHDEVRYLAKEEDRYRCALALQIANAWTRALFCFNLGMSEMPQGIAFFSAVDVDFVLRKEVFMSCETPSHPNPIPSGESLDIFGVLEKTGGSLGQVRRQSEHMDTVEDTGQPVVLFPDLKSTGHKMFLEAQANSVGAQARRWLNSQAPLRGFEGMELKTAKEKARKMAKGNFDDFDFEVSQEEYDGLLDLGMREAPKRTQSKAKKRTGAKVAVAV